MIVFAVFAFLVVPVGFFVFHQLTKKYLNPYKLIFVFGKKGSGKSTLLTKYALEYQQRGYSVYATEDFPGCYKICYEDIGVVQFPPHR